MLCYCGNVHPGESLSEVEGGLHAGPARVRQLLGTGELDYGLWLGRSALTELRSDGIARLRDMLDVLGLRVSTCNAFPYGNFHASSVKRAVYAPNWSDPARTRYTLDTAEVLAGLLPAGVTQGTISTLPIGYRADLDPAQVAHAGHELVAVARGLDVLAQNTGRSIRLCLEPEPSCFLETSADVVLFWNTVLHPMAHRELGPAADEILDRHLGVCWDTCHHAVQFEEPKAIVQAYRDAGITIGKVQLSCALELDGDDPRARAALRHWHEPRFLHQVRVRSSDRGMTALHAIDDLDQVSALPETGLWRVHFHVPIHADIEGPLRTTQPQLVEAATLLHHQTPAPHFEVETYTWDVLPPELRPRDAEGLAQGIAAEMRWAREILG